MAETRPRAIGDVSAVYRTQLRLLRKWSGGWTGLAIRDAGVLGVSVVALLLTTRLVRGVGRRGAGRRRGRVLGGEHDPRRRDRARARRGVLRDARARARGAVPRCAPGR